MDFTSDEDHHQVKEYMRVVKPFFMEKLGKYTHKRISDQWYFHSMAFSNYDMGYVFGINIGFFKPVFDEQNAYAGMNMTIRTDGQNPSLKYKFLTFFRKNLKDWVNYPEATYNNTERGDSGIILARYKKLSDFENTDLMIDFFTNCIIKYQGIYPELIKNEDLIFSEIVRAAPDWREYITVYFSDMLEHSK